MSTHLFPQEWDAVPLDDLGLCEVVDVLLGWRDRTAGSVAVVITDSAGRIVAPFVVEQVPADCGAWERHEFVTQLVDVACHVAPGGGIALGVGRPGDAAPTLEDLSWSSALQMACEEARVSCQGCVLATATAVVALDDDGAAAA